MPVIACRQRLKCMLHTAIAVLTLCQPQFIGGLLCFWYVPFLLLNCDGEKPTKNTLLAAHVNAEFAQRRISPYKFLYGLSMWHKCHLIQQKNKNTFRIPFCNSFAIEQDLKQVESWRRTFFFNHSEAHLGKFLVNFFRWICFSSFSTE